MRMDRVINGLPLPVMERKDTPGTDTVEIKNLVTQYMTAFEEYKKTVTADLTELKKTGNVDPTTTAKLSAMDKMFEEVKGSVEALRLEVKRPALETGKDGKVVSPEKKAHREAFLKYARKGHSDGLLELEQKASLVGSDPDGGFLVPEDMSGTLERILSEASPIRQLCDVISISTSLHKRPVTISGAASGWVGETQARPQTGTPQLSELSFPTMELYAMPAATQSLLDDAAINIEEWLAGEVRIKFAEDEGAAFISGNGVSQPRGFLSYDKYLYADAEVWGQTGYVKTGAAADFPAVNPADCLIDLIQSIKAGYRNGSSFIANRATIRDIRKFKTGDGEYLWRPGLTENRPDSILGYPITEAEDMPDTDTNTFPMAFGNFKLGYLIVDRIGIRILRDPYTAKPYVLFYTTKRVGGGVKMFEAFRLLKCEA